MVDYVIDWNDDEEEEDNKSEEVINPNKGETSFGRKTSKTDAVCPTCGEDKYIRAIDKDKGALKRSQYMIFFTCLECLTSFSQVYDNWYNMNISWLRYRSTPEKNSKKVIRYVDRPDRRWYYKAGKGWQEDIEYINEV